MNTPSQIFLNVSYFGHNRYFIFSLSIVFFKALEALFFLFIIAQTLLGMKFLFLHSLLSGGDCLVKLVLAMSSRASVNCQLTWWGESTY